MKVNQEALFKQLDDAAGRLVRAIALAIASGTILVHLFQAYDVGALIERLDMFFAAIFFTGALCLGIWSLLLMLAASYSFKAAIIDGLSVKGGSLPSWFAFHLAFLTFTVTCSAALAALLAPTVLEIFRQ